MLGAAEISAYLCQQQTMIVSRLNQTVMKKTKKAGKALSFLPMAMLLLVVPGTSFALSPFSLFALGV